MIDSIVKETTRTPSVSIGEPPRFRYPLYPEFLVSLLGIFHLFHLRTSRITLSSRNPQVPYTFVASTRLSHSRFTHAQIEAGSPFGLPKKEEICAWKGTSIRRVNTINESARITCPATRSRSSPRSALHLLSPLTGPLLGLRYVCPPRPTVRVFSAREARALAINSPLALTVDAGHDIRNVARIQCFRALDGNRRFQPSRWECRLEKPVSRADSLFASPTKP